MHFVEHSARRYAQFDQLRSAPGLTHAFSTRPDVVASGDGPRSTTSRTTFAADWGFDPAHLHHCRQVHQPGLALIRAPEGGPLVECDGAATALPGVSLMTFSADCPLVLLYDPVRRAVGMAHASWRCTVARVCMQLVELMVDRLNCRADDLHAGIGPGAGPCCYEVGDDVYQAAADLPGREACFTEHAGRLHFDLWQANRQQLVTAGLEPRRIEAAGICTICAGRDTFYSYRREGPRCGHFALLAGITRADRL
jgi:YfiH family protein